MDENGDKGICVEVVKIEENDPVILPEMSPEETPTAAADSTPQISFDTINAQQNTTPELLMTSEIKTAPPNPELIRLFGPTTSQPVDIDGNRILQAGSLASQFCPLGPKERCTPSQAQAMGEQILGLMAMHESNGTPLPFELQNTFDIFHRCLAVAYGTFFLNLYTKANAPCVLCHGCKSLYPPGQYIHHSCLALPPNIVPCRSRMWRRCLVPLMSQDMDKADQKERWKFVLEKFSHAAMGVGKRNMAHLSSEPQILEMPELKKGKFVGDSKMKSSKTTKADDGSAGIHDPISSSQATGENNGSVSPSLIDEDRTMIPCVSDEEISGEVTFNERLGSSRTFELIRELVREVGKLEHELAETKEKLKQMEDKLKAVTSGDSLSDQFVQSLLAREKLSSEKKVVMEKLQLEEEKSAKLEKQLNRIQLLHLEMQNQFKL